jgi:hypothetical protein
MRADMVLGVSRLAHYTLASCYVPSTWEQWFEASFHAPEGLMLNSYSHEHRSSCLRAELRASKALHSLSHPSADLLGHFLRPRQPSALKFELLFSQSSDARPAP